MNSNLILANAFSINMLKTNCSVEFVDIKESLVKKVIKNYVCLFSIIGHDSMAKFLSGKLGIQVDMNRANFKWGNGEGDVLVCSPMMRLVEGKVLNEDEIKSIPVKYTLCRIYSR